MNETGGTGQQPGGPGGARPGDYGAPGPGGSGAGQPGRGAAGGGQAGWTPAQGQQGPPGTPPPAAGWQAGPPAGGLPLLPRRGGTKRRRGWGSFFLVAIVAGIIGALLVLIAFPWSFGVNPWDIVRGNVRRVLKQETTARKGVTKVVSPTEGALAVAGIAKKVIPSIVNIDIRTAPQKGTFFNTAPQEGTGSGVIISEDGYIITNNHVVRDAQDITVTLASGQELKGKRVGADPDNDIAVVKVDKAGLPPLTIGNSDDLTVGELAVAVGSPYGFEQSVTSGIISGLHRNVSEPAGQAQQGSVLLTDLIQTDAAVNPGNSGGALSDSRALLIGINTLIASSSGGNEGVSFAVPVNTAKRVADDIIAGRPISHPYIGIMGQTVSQNIADQYNLPVSKGAYVTRVVPDGPAGKAGIKAGDIVVAIDEKPVKSMDDLINEVRSRKVGEKVSLTYYSGNDKKTAEVTLEEKPKSLQ